MLRNRLIIGVAVLVLLGVIVGYAVNLEPPAEEVNTLERTAEETIAVSEQPAEEPNVGLIRPAEEANTFTIKGYVTVDAYHYDAATGTYVLFYHDESSNLITNIGFDWIEDQLGDTPATDPAKWISVSLDATSPGVGWTQIITEIAAGGLARAVGTYTSTGTGVWTIAVTFTASATHTNVQLTGLQWASSGDGNLMAANTFTAVTLNNGDTLTITWTLTLT